MAVLRYNIFMQSLKIANPFGAPVYYAECVASTMVTARSLAASGSPPGSVIVSAFQEQGRGRTGRSWEAEPGSSLLFTLLLRYSGLAEMPRALTLRTGLALALAIEAFAPPLRAEVKWPNDIMLGGKKAAGILSEGDGGDVYVGIGVNLFQKEFPPELQGKATSIARALGEMPGQNAEHKAVSEESVGQDRRFALLEKILDALYRELRSPLSWQDRLEARLYLKGKPVRFAPGSPGSDLTVEGILRGVGPGGELLIAPSGGGEVKSFASGELRVYGTAAV
jgi:BirA family biotin operon repressor/biotin-[acetyl-CoA-carboxylase] ligase